VVIPAIRREAQLSRSGFRTLVDLGSGDGFVTAELLRDVPREYVQRIVLVDRSTAQLRIARARAQLRRAEILAGDILSRAWVRKVAATPSPRLLLSVFVLQELPSLRDFFLGLASCMSADDSALCVIVAPTYSASLARRGATELVSRGELGRVDWVWAGRYPISLASSRTIYLPHFQRPLRTYREAASKAGLSVKGARCLAVPPSERARRVFTDTAYGNEIVGRTSSLLLTIRRRQGRGGGKE
jgi:SAM-dependent methyltransferase